MELELHQLDLRYEKLRRRDPRRERQLVASLAEVGQLLPVVVLAADSAGRHVLVDGYKRERAHRRLRLDTMRATVWALEEAEALLLERLMRTTEREGPLEQGWLLVELRARFGLGLDELARRFDRSASWVSRRLALVGELPEEIQEQVRAGTIAAYAAMKYLVPLARANRGECLQLAAALAARRASTREVAALYAGWHAGAPTRELVLGDPGLFLRAQEEARRAEAPAVSPAAQLVGDLGALGGIARRVQRRLREGLARRLAPTERDEVRRCALQARSDAEAVFARLLKEVGNAGPEHTSSDPQAA
jgi:ParB family chromosome partitioning protein